MSLARVQAHDMTAVGDVAYQLILVGVLLLLPLGLMLILFLMSRTYRGMFDEIGFTRKEMGLLLVGSLSVLLVPVDVPVFAYREYFLAFNVGGALIPVVLSIHLLRAKRVGWPYWLPSVIGVSLVTFFITRVQPAQGIVAEFPYLFIPSVSATLLALVLFSRDSPKTAALAYSTATLGSLIGADVYHLPELFATQGFIGSIGGAGVFDLVYVAGILSFSLVLIFGSRRLRRIRRTVPHAELAQERIAWELRASLYAIWTQQYQMSIQRTLGAVQEKIRAVAAAFGHKGSLPNALYQTVPNPVTLQQYQALAQQANNPHVDYSTAYWAIAQGQNILQQLHAAERTRFATVGQRVGAFSIDASVILALVVALYYGISFLAGIADPFVLFLTFLFWAWSTQLFYFTLFEYFWKGYTPGKRVVGIRVADRNGRPLDFITVFTRNVVRILDFVAFAYVPALIVMTRSQRVQRPGDMVADTVVLRRRLGPVNGLRA